MKKPLPWLAIGLLACAASAEAVKPDFSGSWKLNNPKSTYDGKNVQDLAPDRVTTLTIAQSKNNLTLATKGEPAPNQLDRAWTIDGKERIERDGKNYRYARASWEGATLVLELSLRDSKKDTAKYLMFIRESWQLSPDGNVLTAFRRTNDSKRIIDQKYVFDKHQEVSHDAAALPDRGGRQQLR